MHVDICIPIFDDWASASALLRKLDTVAKSLAHELHVWFVDDGSREPIPAELSDGLAAIRAIHVLRLRRNLGHQRAIAVGLTHLYVASACDAVVVMDGDGEDDPEHVRVLLEHFERGEPDAVLFAKRARRTEGVGFRLGYVGFKVVHRILTGRPVEVGNFSVIPRSALARLVGVSELWNHYAAAVFNARLPTDKLPLPRASRIAGESKMHVVSLVTHGLSAISVYGEIVGVRMLFAAFFAMLGVIATAAIVVGLRLHQGVTFPGWTTTVSGLLFVTLLNMLLLSAGAVLVVLQARTRSNMIPLKDYAFYILEELRLLPPPQSP